MARIRAFGFFGDDAAAPPAPELSPPVSPGPPTAAEAGVMAAAGLVMLLGAGLIGAFVMSQKGTLRANARGSAPKYLLGKKGRTGKRQRHAAAVYLGRRRQGNATKKEAYWAAKHLAHGRFNTNGSRQKYVVLWRHAAGTTLPSTATVATVQRLCAKKGISATIATELGSGRLMHIGTVDKSGAFHGAQRV